MHLGMNEEIDRGMKEVDIVADMLASSTLIIQTKQGDRRFRVPQFLLDNDKAGLIAILLRRAIESNQPLTIQFLINQGAKLNEPLCDIRNLESLINSQVGVLDQDPAGNYPLHLAAKLGYSEVVEVLVQSGAAKNQVNGRGEIPLHIAYGEKKSNVVVQLINADADINLACPNSGWTILHKASSDGDEGLVRLLLSKGATVDAITKKASTALHVACSEGFESIVTMLIAAEASLILKTLDREETSLHIAVRVDNPRIVAKLIDAGSNPNTFNKFGQTPLMCACNSALKDNVKVLLEKGADPRLTNSIGGETAAHSLFSYNKKTDGSLVEILKLLDAHGMISFCELDAKGNTPLHNACFSNGDAESVEFLVRKNPSIVNQLNFEDDSPLCKATMCVHNERNLRVVKVLLANGAKPNLHGPSTVPALFNLARQVSWDMCTHYPTVLAIAQLLIRKGADVNSRLITAKWRGFTPLEEAVATAGAPEMVKLLIDNGAIVDPKYLEEIYSAYSDNPNGRIAIAKILLEQISDLEACTTHIDILLEHAYKDRIFLEPFIMIRKNLDQAHKDFQSALDTAIAIQGRVHSGAYIGQPSRDLREVQEIYTGMNRKEVGDYNKLLRRCVELKTKNHPVTLAARELCRALEARNQNENPYYRHCIYRR